MGWEDELDDSGSATLDVKIRVQDRFFFVLLRNAVRVDNVLVRTVETRIFGNLGGFGRRKGNAVEFHQSPERPLRSGENYWVLPLDGRRDGLLPGHIWREWMVCEASYEKLISRGDLTKGKLDQVATALTKISAQRDVCTLKGRRFIVAFADDQ